MRSIYRNTRTRTWCLSVVLAWTLLLCELLLIPTAANADPVAIDINKCKISYVNNRPGVADAETRIGWPLATSRIPGRGTQKILVLPIDFPDAESKQTPATLVSDLLKPELAKRFYSVQSNGSVSLDFEWHQTVHRMQFPSDQYGWWNSAKTSWGLSSDKIGKEIEEILNRNYAKFDYAAVVILVTGRSSAWKAWGVPGVSFTQGSSASFFGQSSLKNVMYLVDNDGSTLSDILTHELGHLFGFVDLYASGYMADSTGPFDVMAYHWEKSKSFLGWNLWLRGWIQDSQVLCLNYGYQPVSEVSLSSLTLDAGKRLLVLRESADSVVVIEARLNTEYDDLGANAGLLVYRVRPGAIWPDRVVQILPHSNEITTRGVSPDFPDAQRFLRATVTSGKYLRERHLLIENKQQTMSNIVVSLAWLNDANAQQRKADAESKTLVQSQAASEAEASQLRMQILKLESQIAQISEAMRAMTIKNRGLAERLAGICKTKPKPRGC